MEAVDKAARWCLSRGISVIPIDPGTKRPTVEWKGLQNSCLESWDFGDCNMAILTGEYNRIVVVDCDSLESYKGWLANRPMTPLRTRTHRGMHFFYRHPGQYVKSGTHFEAKEGFKYDIKGDRSYVLAPPSIRDCHQYQFCICKGNIAGRWIDPGKLPVFDMAWRPETQSIDTWDSGHIKDIKAYISTIHALEGQGGDKATFRVARKICDSGVDKAEAMALMFEWNQTNAHPEWSPRDLYRKLDIAYGTKQ